MLTRALVGLPGGETVWLRSGLTEVCISEKSDSYIELLYKFVIEKTLPLVLARKIPKVELDNWD